MEAVRWERSVIKRHKCAGDGLPPLTSTPRPILVIVPLNAWKGVNSQASQPHRPLRPLLRARPWLFPTGAITQPSEGTFRSHPDPVQVPLTPFTVQTTKSLLSVPLLLFTRTVGAPRLLFLALPMVKWVFESEWELCVGLPGGQGTHRGSTPGGPARFPWDTRELRGSRCNRFVGLFYSKTAF